MAKNIDPDQTQIPGNSLVRVYSVYFHVKISSEVHLNICSRHHFQDKILACLGLSLLSCSESN